MITAQRVTMSFYDLGLDASHFRQDWKGLQENPSWPILAAAILRRDNATRKMKSITVYTEYKEEERDAKQ